MNIKAIKHPGSINHIYELQPLISHVNCNTKCSDYLPDHLIKKTKRETASCQDGDFFLNHKERTQGSDLKLQYMGDLHFVGGKHPFQ